MLDGKALQLEMHNHKLEIIWHFSRLKMKLFFFIKMSQVLTPCTEPSWDWERGQHSSSSARALPASHSFSISLRVCFILTQDFELEKKMQQNPSWKFCFFNSWKAGRASLIPNSIL